MGETLKWCGVDIDIRPPSRNEVDSVMTYLENPIEWLKSFLRRIPSEYKYRLEFLQLLVQHDNSQDLRLALTHFLSQPGFHPRKYARNCADNLVRLLFTPIKFHPIGVRELLDKLKEKDICGME